MAVIAILIDDMFEDVEYTTPAKAFREAGHSLVHLGLKKGAEVKGKKEGTVVAIDLETGSADPAAFDALFIPGGYSPDRLRAHKEPVVFARAFMETQKPLFLICHAPQLLISARVLEGRKLTGWKSVAVDIKNAGAEYIDAPVVIDGNMVSSRGPKDLPQFLNTCVEMLSKH
ncbi:type 1 glutamine amidotransferase [Chitinispirillales bacterium ANBcel5]|uniref:type 1 glutamine amidotransferase domain-containing protein n=1 Tax=Cellulosispirillum alkaliphilum TaxID=3039283 RepID=UPI002A525623|nr:type 1 glutamine amidotransferase [Chitinispirillales bacterium ANBcel5]